MTPLNHEMVMTIMPHISNEQNPSYSLPPLVPDRQCLLVEGPAGVWALKSLQIFSFTATGVINFVFDLIC